MQLPSRAEILILCAAVIHRFSWSLFRMMVTALKLTTVRSSIQWNFPFFFLFWDHLPICRLAMCYYHTFQNAIRKLSWSVYLQKLRGIFVTNLFWNFIYLVTPKPALSCIPTIFQVERLNNTFFNSSSRNLTFRVPTWVILLYQFLNRGTLQFAYICAVSFSVTNLNLRQQEKHLYS